MSRPRKNGYHFEECLKVIARPFDMNLYLQLRSEKVRRDTCIAKARGELEELHELTPSEEAWLRQFCNEMLAK